MAVHILDHNLLIDIERKNDWGTFLASKIAAAPNKFCVVNIGASELLVRGVRPDRYDLFNDFLRTIGLDKLVRLNPLFLIDITFIGYSNIASDEDVLLYERLTQALFPDNFDDGQDLIEQPPYEPIGRKRLNRICDVVTLWCHVKYRTTSLITRDKDFLKKANALKDEFGANIIHPRQLT